MRNESCVCGFGVGRFAPVADFFYGNAFADDIEWLLDQMCFVGFGRDWECGMEKWQSVEIGLFEQCEFAVFHCSSCRLQLANKVS